MRILPAGGTEQSGASKLALLIVLCVAWLVPGLVGHEPWKSDDAATFGIAYQMLQSGDWLVPALAGDATLAHPPLYHWVAALLAQMFSPWLALHDGARLASGFFVALALIATGLAARALYGPGIGRPAVLVLMGCVGLLADAHAMLIDNALFAAYAIALYGLTLAARFPLRAGLLLGQAWGMAFLAGGVLPLLVLVSAAALLALFPAWRGRPYGRCLVSALLVSLPWLVIWPYLLHERSPELLNLFWDENARRLLDLSPAHVGKQLAHFLAQLTWFAWPALPLAAWTVWGYRRKLLQEGRYLLPLLFFGVVLLSIVLASDRDDTYAMPLLLPLSLLAAAGLDTQRRGAANALGWFGNMTFALAGFFLWFAWVAMMTGIPQRFSAHLVKLQPGFVPTFSWLPFAVAVALTLFWLLPVRRSFKSGRKAVANWAAGITLMWGLLATLWLPWLNHGKSHKQPFAQLKQHLPANYNCIASAGLGPAHRALLHYYAGITTRQVEDFHGIECNLFVLQFNPRDPDDRPGPGWKVLWEGGRPGDKKERFRLLTFERAQS
jgi:4-amino-4-deoxy-L-arabinose transferase-like glycosyltransferase